MRILKYGNYGILLTNSGSRTLNYGKYGIFHTMGNAGFITSTVLGAGATDLVRCHQVVLSRQLLESVSG